MTSSHQRTSFRSLAETAQDCDWSIHPLGPPESWPVPLVACVETCLAFPSPAAVFWGEQAYMFFNDSFAGMTADPSVRQPWGKPAAAAMGLSWAMVKPVLDRVRHERAPVESREVRWEVSNGAHRYEHFFDVRYHPAYVSEGTVSAVQALFVDATERFLHHRRVALIHALVQLVEDASAGCLDDVLTAYTDDITCVLTFELQPDSNRATLHRCIGWSPEERVTFAACSCRGDAGLPHVFERLLRSRKAEHIADLPSLFNSTPRVSEAAVECAYARVIPCASGAVYALMLGINPLRRWDPAYQSLLESTIALIAQCDSGPSPAQYVTETHAPAILLVEADANDRVYLQTVLSRRYRVISTSDCTAALAALRRTRPAAIVAGALTCSQGGVPAVNALLEACGGSVPLIMTTSRMVSDLDGLGGRAVAAVLSKPYGAREVLETVGTILRSWQPASSDEIQHAIAEAIEQERVWIKRALHDNLAQSLAVARMTLEALRERTNSEAIVADLCHVDLLLEEGLSFTRSLIGEINELATPHRRLCEILQRVCASMTRYRLTVECDSAGAPDVPPPVATAVADCLRELLMNVVKHAETNHAAVRATIEQDGGLVVTVTDAGRGCDASEVVNAIRAPERYGLASVDERMRMLGGALRFASTPGTGTTGTLRLPASTIHRSTGNNESDHAR